VKHGFKLIKKEYIQEIKTVARLFRHEKTAAELLSLEGSDENKVFGAAFRTPPKDSTGVAHILEHSVLCGSRKYPVKEPFVELLKGSLQTFLNAFTYPDKTCYPVASQNREDFYNLVDVYLDAVFYPRLTPEIFQQEGWHMELENPEGPMGLKGVVFNEMKGAYSAPENLLSEYSVQSVFPDTPYCLDSGGHPRDIPDLDYDSFLEFHKKYYHPSNCRFFFYGDDPPDERLRMIDGYIGNFEHDPADSSIALQPYLSKPRHVTRSYIAGQGEGSDSKGMITLNWLLPESVDAVQNFSMHILEYILLGMPASPLRKALIDSGLGEDIAGEGLGAELRQMYLSTGLKGIDIENSEKIEALVLETLQGMVQKGIDEKTVEAAINTVEFRLRENNAGSFPKGLLLMLRALTTWLYGGDPLVLLSFEKSFKIIKNHLEDNKNYFEDLIRVNLLDNPHRTTLVLRPDPELERREESEERDILSKRLSSMNKEEKRKVIDSTLYLKKIQGTPDTPEALATVPCLKKTDLERRNKQIPFCISSAGGTKVLTHDIFTSGIAHLDIGFDLHAISAAELSYMPLFGRALTEMGTRKEDFVSLSKRISRKTGGIWHQIFTSPLKGKKESSSWLFLRGKAMVNQAEELTGLFSEVLCDIRLDNRKRFHQMVLEEKARREQKLIPQGHLIVNTRLMANFGEAHWVSEMVGGISYLFFLRKLGEDVEKDWPKVLQTLESIHGKLVNSRNAIINLTLDEKGIKRLDLPIKKLQESLPEQDIEKVSWTREKLPFLEAMSIPSKVNYVGKGGDLYSNGYEYHGSAQVISRYLRNTFLWDQVRVQGGAYGAFCLFERLSGLLSLVSYRDPNLTGTIDVFDRAGRFLLESNLNDAEITKAIIGAIGDLDRHMLPDAKGFISMLRYLTDDDEKGRQQMRDQIFETGKDHFIHFGSLLNKLKHEFIIKILGSPAAIERLRGEMPDLRVIKIL